MYASRFFTCTLLISAAIVAANAQTSPAPPSDKPAQQSGETIHYKATWERPEFGDIKEIAAKTKVYVGSSDLEARKVIVKELAKDNRLEVVGDQDDCEFMISYGTEWMTTGASVLGSTVTANSRDIGEFVVTTRGKPDHAAKVVRQRIVWSTKKQQSYVADTTLNPHPAINATREFLKDLEKARRAQASAPPKQDISPPSSGSAVSLSSGSDVSPATAMSRPTILYKERAKYTNEARAHRIEGTVRLRVEFLAAGRIGRVEVIRGLPYGLSESAVEAAKRVRFNPAVKNGVPVSVQGAIDFTFTL